jgi:hypothetical protein
MPIRKNKLWTLFREAIVSYCENQTENTYAFWRCFLILDHVARVDTFTFHKAELQGSEP